MASVQVGQHVFVKIDSAQKESQETWHRGIVIKIEGGKGTLVLPLGLGEPPGWAEGLTTFRSDDNMVMGVCGPTSALRRDAPKGALKVNLPFTTEAAFRTY